jgi:hypothetical protein
MLCHAWGALWARLSSGAINFPYARLDREAQLWKDHGYKLHHMYAIEVYDASKLDMSGE